MRGTWLSSRSEIQHMMGQLPLDTHDGRPGNRGAIVNIATPLGLGAQPDAGAPFSSKLVVPFLVGGITPLTLINAVADVASKAATISCSKSDAVHVRVRAPCTAAIDHG